MNLSESNATCADEQPYPDLQIFFRLTALLPLTALGLATNLFNVLIFTHRAMRVSLVNWFLLGLALSDSLLLTSTVSMLGFPVLAETAGDFPSIRAAQYIARWSFPLGQFAQACSVYLILMASGFRYLGVCRPFLAQRIGTRENVGRALGLTVFLCLLFTLPRWAELTTKACWSKKFGRESVAVDLTALSTNTAYHLGYKIIANTLFMFLGPFSTLIILNSFIVHTLRNSRRLRRSMMDATENWIKHTPNIQREDSKLRRSKSEKSAQQRHESKENNITFMLLAIVSIFLLCNLLPSVNNALELLLGHSGLLSSESFRICVEVGNVLVALNSSLYIFIYLVFNEKFRMVSKYLLRIDRTNPVPMSRTTTVRRPPSRRQHPSYRASTATYRQTEELALLSPSTNLHPERL